MTKKLVRSIDVLTWANRGWIKASGTDVCVYRAEHGRANLHLRQYRDVSAATLERLSRLSLSRRYTIHASFSDTHTRVELWSY
jgi:hypothetical protein